MRHGQDRRRVAAGRLEDDEAEVGDARDPELLAQAEAGHGVHGGIDQQVDEVEIHPVPRLTLIAGLPLPLALIASHLFAWRSLPRTYLPGAHCLAPICLALIASHLAGRSGARRASRAAPRTRSRTCSRRGCTRRSPRWRCR